MNDEYNFSDSISFSSEVSKEVYLTGPSLGMELLPYRFELPDPFPADFHAGVYFTSASTEMEVNHVGNIN